MRLISALVLVLKDDQWPGELFSQNPWARSCNQNSNARERFRCTALSQSGALVMIRRGEFPVASIAADEMRRSLGTIWNAVILLAKDKDLLAVCAVSAIGLMVSLAFAMSPSVTSKSAELFAQAAGW
jgi:hypothetical protein